MNKFTFTRLNRKTGKVENAGYLEMKNAGSGRAELCFYGDIVSASWQTEWYPDDKCPQDIADFLSEIEKVAELDIRFNSGGGDVFAGIAIYNTLKRHPGVKRGYVDGLCASIASVILMACDELYISTGAQLMIHKPWSFALGNADEMRRCASDLDRAQDAITDIYMLKAADGVTREVVTDAINAETWMNAEKAAMYFHIQVEERESMAACASAYFEKYANLPPALAKAEEREAEKERKAKAERLVSDLYLYGT